MADTGVAVCNNGDVVVDVVTAVVRAVVATAFVGATGVVADVGVVDVSCLAGVVVSLTELPDFDEPRCFAAKHNCRFFL